MMLVTAMPLLLVENSKFTAVYEAQSPMLLNYLLLLLAGCQGLARLLLLVVRVVLVQVVWLLLVGRRLSIVESVVVLLPVAGHGRLVVRGLVDQSRVVRDSGVRISAIAVTAAQ